MALDDEIREGREELNGLNQEIAFLLDAVSSIGDRLVEGLRRGSEEASDVSKILKRGIVNDINQAVKNTEEFVKFQQKAQQGGLKQSEIQKLQSKLEENRNKLLVKRETLRLQGVSNLDEELSQLQGQIDLQERILGDISSQNTLNQENIDLLDLAQNAAKTFADNIDKSGTLSKILSGELSQAQKQALLAQAALSLVGLAALNASSAVNDIQKLTGLSYLESLKLQASFASIALESEKLFLNSKEIAAAFTELTKQTGLIADFGGQTLVTQATLTKQLGLSAEQAGKLSLLSRLQSENTEGILSSTVDTVGAISKQSGVALNVKNILEEIGNISAAISVSLGKNPIELARAAAEAKLFGANLSVVDGIASSLLDFESSIVNELQAELLIGKNINLEKARLLALNNDLAGLSKELANNEAIIEAFSTGNRIQQEAAAAALGLQREELAQIALQQDFNNLSAQQFRDTYGDVTYESLQAQSANEKFLSAINKVKGILGDIGILLAPIVDSFAYIVGAIAESQAGLIIIGGILGGLLARQAALAVASLVEAVGKIFASSAKFGPVGIATALGGVAAMFAAAKAASSLATADDMIAPAGYGDRILSTPKGSIALNNQDTIVAGTNLGGDNREAKETNMLLRQILTKQGTVRIDSVQAGTAFAMNTYQVQ